jgi:hypothetical protein
MKLPDSDRQSAYRAVDRWINAALRADDSLFTPGRAIWSARWLEDLRHRFMTLRPQPMAGLFSGDVAVSRRWCTGTPSLASEYVVDSRVLSC